MYCSPVIQPGREVRLLRCVEQAARKLLTTENHADMTIARMELELALEEVSVMDNTEVWECTYLHTGATR